MTTRITAPQILSESDMKALLARWQQTRMGGVWQFYRFMTTPGPARDAFINECSIAVDAWAGANAIIIKP